MGSAADGRGAPRELARGPPIHGMGGGAVPRRGELADVEIARPRLVVGVVDEQRVGNRGCGGRARYPERRKVESQPEKSPAAARSTRDYPLCTFDPHLPARR